MTAYDHAHDERPAHDINLDARATVALEKIGSELTLLRHIFERHENNQRHGLNSILRWHSAENASLVVSVPELKEFGEKVWRKLEELYQIAEATQKGL